MPILGRYAVDHRSIHCPCHREAITLIANRVPSTKAELPCWFLHEQTQRILEITKYFLKNKLTNYLLHWEFDWNHKDREVSTWIHWGRTSQGLWDTLRTSRCPTADSWLLHLWIAKIYLIRKKRIRENIAIIQKKNVKNLQIYWHFSIHFRRLTRSLILLFRTFNFPTFSNNVNDFAHASR